MIRRAEDAIRAAVSAGDPLATLVDGEPSARVGGASRPSNEGNNNFLVW
jgi:hypothetical protein